MVQPIYATTVDFNSSAFSADDDGSPITVTQGLLRRASILIDSLIRGAHYQIDEGTQLPTDQHVIDALRDATCAQAAWFVITGDASGAQAILGPMSLGPLSFGGRTTAASTMPTSDTQPRTSPEAVVVLQNANLLAAAVTAW